MAMMAAVSQKDGAGVAVVPGSEGLRTAEGCLSPAHRCSIYPITPPSSRIPRQRRGHAVDLPPVGVGLRLKDPFNSSHG